MHGDCGASVSLDLSDHVAALAAWFEGANRTSRSQGARPAPAVRSEGVFEATFPAHSIVTHDSLNLQDSAVSASPPPAAVTELVALLQPALRQLLSAIEPELQLWSVTALSMVAGAERGAHVDPGRYSLVATLTLSGEGAIHFKPVGSCRHEAVSARADAGHLVAFCGDARNRMKHAVKCGRHRLALVFRYGPPLY